jgi:glycosyltransferase involved in cell wall biosynthesis
MAKQKLSVTIITRNEEKRIRDALESVVWADEIVVVDSGSTDRTIEICREYTQHVFQENWHGYVEQKNIANAKSSYNWILNVDADEVVSPELAAEIQTLLADEPSHTGYSMPRRTYYLGAWIRHCGWYPDEKLRLFDKRLGCWVGRALHEKVQIEGTTASLRHDLYHYTYESVEDHLRTINNYTSIAASQKQGSISAAGILGHTVFTFFKKYIVKQGFRDGSRGLIVSLLSAFTVAVKYAKLWELRHVEERSDTP